MRLLNTKDLSFRNFVGVDRPQYDILSHRWEGDETTLQLFESERGLPLEQCSAGNRKIREFCNLVNKESGSGWCWVDTCCIDKTSSAELTEAINSMYSWYSNAAHCVVYLSDVEDLQDGQLIEKFKMSAWFRRGWTLQELLAPSRQSFFDKRWKPVGDRSELADTISQVTSISKYCFGDTRAIRATSVARRFSWAAHRLTSRVEDLAYCLLGIFDVNMPLIYGEGIRAFFRLQLEILKISTDETIFAWKAKRYVSGMLAEHPNEFADTEYMGVMPSDVIQRAPYMMTNRGLSFSPKRDMSMGELDMSLGDRTHYWVALDCVFRSGSYVSICLTRFLGKWVRIHCNHLMPIFRVESPPTSMHQHGKRRHRKKMKKLIEKALYRSPEIIHIAQFDIPDQELYKRCGTGCVNSEFDDIDVWPADPKASIIDETTNTCNMLNSMIL